MIYLKTSNRYERRRSTRILGLAGAIVAILVVTEFFVPHLLPAFFTSFTAPFWRAQFAMESGSLQSPAALLNENQELRRELDTLRLQSETVTSVIRENDELKKILGREGENASTTSQNISNRILAPVLAHPPLAPYDELVIDGGADLGFKTGEKVYANEEVLIGTITDVLSGTSKVVLFSSPGQRYSVTIGPTNAPAFASGRGGGQYSAELPRIVTVKEGDEVLAPSLNDKPFGIVRAVLSDPARPFETVLFSPPINIYELRWVLVENLKS